MEILGGRKYVEIAGERTHELPPLQVRSAQGLRRLDRVLNLAESVVESEDMIPPGVEAPLEQRRYELALSLADE